MNIRPYIWALGFLSLPFSPLPGSADAEPINLTTTTAGALSDTDGDGIAESGWFYGIVSLAPGIHENRAFAEYDTSGLEGPSVLSAWLSGPIETNGNFNRGSTIQVSAYAGNGEFDLADFARSALPIGTFSVPPAVWESHFELEVTDAVRQLLAQNATWIGFRFASLTSFENVRIGQHASNFGVLLTVEQPPAVPEPGTLLLLGTGVSALLMRRRRQPFGR